MPVRFVIADDHDVLRHGVRVLLETNPNWKVVAEARDGQEALEKVRAFKPDIAILDLSMPLLTGFHAAREIIRNLPKTKVLILTIYDSDVLRQEMRQLGVHGYIVKRNAGRDLVPAVTALLSNRLFFPEWNSFRHRPLARGTKKIPRRLTPRQTEVVKLLAEGMRNDKIVKKLGISMNTLETHRQNIRLRTNCHTTADLVRYAIRNGIIGV